MNNTTHLFEVSYGSPGRCTGSESFYAKSYKQARAMANGRCARHERVMTLEKAGNEPAPNYPLLNELLANSIN